MRIAPFLWLLVAAPLFAQEGKRADSPKLVPDVVYQKVGDREVKIDLAIPTKGKGPYPAVLCVHGGAWRLGSRKELSPLIQTLAENGYAAATVQYRLVPEVKLAQQIGDVKTAVRWLRENAATYDIDPKRIGAVGFSAGGHLVCLLGLTGPDDGFEGTLYPKQSSKVQCVVDYFGPTDLSAWGDETSAQNGFFKPMLGASYHDDPERHRKASPLSYVKKDAPPFLVIHGTKDPLVPFDQSERLVAGLTRAGADAKLITIKDGDHGFYGEDRARAMKETLEFLEKNLKK